MNHSLRTFLCAAVLLGGSLSSYGQGYALPSKTPGTTVPCTTGVCTGTSPTPMTVGYKDPLTTFTGRFLDSTATSEWFMPFRTARANFVLVMPNIDRIYFRYGNGTVVAYTLSKFFTRLEAGEQLVFPINPRPANRSNNPELFLNWDDWFNPELSTWKTFNIDGATRMTGFDVDDKGYVYVASTIYGWGIVKDSLATGGKMVSMVQKFPGAPADAKPGRIAAVKGATRYYAFLSSSTQAMWDVTDRANPVPLSVSVPIMLSFAKNSTADRIAFVDSSYKLNVYSGDALASNGAPLYTDSGNYQYVTSDGTNFYALKNTDAGKMIAVIVPSGSNGYTVQGTYPIGATMQLNAMHYGDGFLVLTGADAGGAWDLRLFKVGANLVPTQIAVNSTPGDPSFPSYFRNYYGTALPGYVTPGYMNMLDGTVYKAPSGKVYLIVCSSGLGDVYELAAGDSISVSNDGRAGRVNANTPATTPAKTFYGDPIQFTARSSSANVSTVAWNFGNPENTSGTNTLQITAKDQPIVYQYSNLDKTKLGTKTVYASNVSDSSIRGSAVVTLDSPVARFGVSNTRFLFTQANASSAAPIVVGDSLVDASDGTLESHYSSWTLDGVSSKSAPDTPLNAGACGTHSVTFSAFYGPYDTTFTTRGLVNFPVALDGPVNYTVRPFAAAVELAAFDATSLTFRSASRFTTDPMLTAAQGFTWTWDLVSSSGAASLTQSGTGAVPNYVLPKQALLGQQNQHVRLTLKANAPFTGACAGLETSIALSNPLSAPDPKITQSGDCQGTPCSFTASSVSGIDTVGDNWTYKWSLLNAPAGTIDPSTILTGPTVTMTFLKKGTFTLQVTATNAVGSGTSAPANLIINTAASPCGTLNASTFVPTWLGTVSGCGPFSPCTSGETVTFRADAPLGSYDPNCATHTYTWTFPDGTTGSGSPINKVVTIGGTVKVTISNGTSTFTYTVSQPLTVGSVTPPPPPPPPPSSNPCDTMTTSNMFLGVSGASCPNGTGCAAGDLLTFQAQPYLYNINCASHNFNWNFGDGATSSQQTAVHAFTTTGPHTVTMTVSNPYQTYVKTLTMTIVAGSSNPGGSCPTMTTSNVAISFQAPSGCSSDNATVPCKNGETVSFNVVSFASYDFSCSPHNYNWSFGDGGTASGKNPTHTFTTSGAHAVSVTISNTTQQNFVRNLTMQTSDGSSNSCGTITPNLTLSINYANNNSTCSPRGGDCATGEVVNFTVIPYLYDLNCAPHTFDWDFGDGSPHASGKDVTHQYAAQGTYNAKCVVSNGGPSVTLTQPVSVKGGSSIQPAVVVSYAVAPLQGVANGYLFTPSFDHPTLVKSWQWDFGDGQKSPMRTGALLPEPKVYADNKSYTVTLTAYDASGAAIGVATHPGELKRRSVRH